MDFPIDDILKIDTQSLKKQIFCLK